MDSYDGVRHERLGGVFSLNPMPRTESEHMTSTATVPKGKSLSKETLQ
jgi:hypothetical protein